ncbi:MAG TPA: hypothetical protein VNS58_19635 [Puia sp.]|nr:hypothetical protein [Puia sp.]
MLKQFILLAAILIAISSCKKGSDASPTPPAKDTSYLRKTVNIYSFDLSGKKLADSSVFKWVYDSKGRVVLYTTNNNNGGDIDTTITSYGTNQITYDVVVYIQGAFSSRSHGVYFYNSQGLVDSTIDTGTNVNINNGVSSTVTYANTGVVVYYFDANGHDTLDVSYTITNNIKSLNSITRNTYTNNTLSTVDSYTANGIRKYSAQWSAGNITTDSEFDFTDGTLWFTHNYTYSSILSGGFYGYVDTKNLLATFQEISAGFPVNSYSETLTYTFDDANRVSSATRKYSNGRGDQQEIYTYY